MDTCGVESEVAHGAGLRAATDAENPSAQVDATLLDAAVVADAQNTVLSHRVRRLADAMVSPHLDARQPAAMSQPSSLVSVREWLLSDDVPAPEALRLVFAQVVHVIYVLSLRIGAFHGNLNVDTVGVWRCEDGDAAAETTYAVFPRSDTTHVATLNTGALHAVLLQAPCPCVSQVLWLIVHRLICQLVQCARVNVHCGAALLALSEAIWNAPVQCAEAAVFAASCALVLQTRSAVCPAHTIQVLAHAMTRAEATHAPGHMHVTIGAFRDAQDLLCTVRPGPEVCCQLFLRVAADVSNCIPPTLDKSALGVYRADHPVLLTGATHGGSGDCVTAADDDAAFFGCLDALRFPGTTDAQPMKSLQRLDYKPLDEHKWESSVPMRQWRRQHANVPQETKAFRRLFALANHEWDWRLEFVSVSYEHVSDAALDAATAAPETVFVCLTAPLKVGYCLVRMPSAFMARHLPATHDGAATAALCEELVLTRRTPHLFLRCERSMGMTLYRWLLVRPHRKPRAVIAAVAAQISHALLALKPTGLQLCGVRCGSVICDTVSGVNYKYLNQALCVACGSDAVSVHNAGVLVRLCVTGVLKDTSIQTWRVAAGAVYASLHREWLVLHSDCRRTGAQEQQLRDLVALRDMFQCLPISAFDIGVALFDAGLCVAHIARLLRECVHAMRVLHTVANAAHDATRWKDSLFAVLECGADIVCTLMPQTVILAKFQRAMAADSPPRTGLHTMAIGL